MSTSDAVAESPPVDDPATASPPTRRAVPTVQLFVVIALVIGTVFVILTPAFTGYDEPYHFVRAWQLSDGKVHSIKHVNDKGQPDLGAYFPGTLYGGMRDALIDGYYAGSRPECHGPSAGCTFRHLTDAAPHGPPMFIGLAPAAVYAPVPYIPAALGIRVARAFGLSTLATLWFGRFFGLVGYVLIVAFAIARMPRWRGVLAVVALAPVCIFQAAMVSADGVTIALALLAIALAMRYATADPGVSLRRALIEVGALGVALGLSKPPYILFLLLFIPAVARHRHELVGRLLPVALLPGIALFVWWSRYAQSVWIAPTNGFGQAINHSYAYVNVDESKQLKHVEHHPLDFLGAVGTTVRRTWRSMLHDMVAQLPNWTAAKFVAGLITVLTFAALALAAAQARSARASDDGSSPGWLELAVDAIVVVGTFVALFLLAYTGWNAVGAPRIDAFQGRYLYPVLAVVAIGIAPFPASWRLRRRAGGPSLAASRDTRLADARLGGILWPWVPWILMTAALVLTAANLIFHYY